MIAVPQSGLVGSTLLTFLNTITDSLSLVWKNTNQMTPPEV